MSRRYRVQLYNVPDKHLYAPLPIRMWHTYWRYPPARRLAVLVVGVDIIWYLYLWLR